MKSSCVLSPLVGFCEDSLAKERWVSWAWAHSAGTPMYTTSLSSAIDYSNSSMMEAEHLLLATVAFVEDARAYMKGQLACGPIQEDVLWER